MLHTKGTIMLRTANQSKRRVWSWDEQTDEGTSLSRELWENIPADRLTVAARDSLRYTLLHGSIISGQTGRLAENEIDDFRIAMQDDGVYVEFTVQGKAKQRLENPPDDGYRYYYGIHMDRAWIGVLFSPELSKLKESIQDGVVDKALLAKHGFSKILWNASSATSASGAYFVNVTGNRIMDLNF